LILGSINIFSNSIQSHNAAVDFFPYVAISVDWLHFMMVSIWVGGLFYISLILSRNLLVKERLSHHQPSIKNVKDSIDVKFFLSTILRFSIVAMISLGIIFITGLYMGVLHLQQPSSILDSAYGNILILKLLVVFSMALLGSYHHFRIPILVNQTKTKETQINQLQTIKKFNKSLKIEYILGIGIIFISSFLTITSPPQHQESHSMDMSTTMNQIGDSNTQKITNTQNQDFDKTFSLIAFVLSISIAILVILFVKRGWKSLKLYTQRK
jgi:putative copper export protein